MRRLLPLAVLAALLIVVSNAGASIQLGVNGSKSRFYSQTTQHTDVNLDTLLWGIHRDSWLDYFLTKNKPIPMVSFGMTGPHATIRPAGIARGYGDRVLVQIAKAINRFGSTVYVRPYAEMNGWWSSYCAYNQNGTYRGWAYSTKNFRKAFRRTYLVIHGGSISAINAALKASGMPAMRRTTDLPVNPVKVFWNPQGYGSPNLPGNTAASYWPGADYVDVVANDLYDIRGKAEWTANLALYRAHPDKPYAFGEWGLWGIDDPSFVKHMADFVRWHPRVKLIVFYKSESGSIFDLASKPYSRAAYKRYIVPLGG
jgi:hypothetical protein